MVAQGALPFKYEDERHDEGLTSLAGLPVCLDLIEMMALAESIDQHIGVRTQSLGYRDSQVVLGLVMLNIAGGDCVDDVERLEADGGFASVLERVELRHLPRQQRRAIQRRWTTEEQRVFPSPSAIRRYLDAFHDKEQETARESFDGKAFIPEPNEFLRGFARVVADLLAFVQRNSPERVATLDLDATLIESLKRQALYSYKGFKGYQPVNVWWAEQQLMVHTEFRDGNVPAGYRLVPVIEQALDQLPEGVEVVRFRSDSAAYDHEVLRYLDQGHRERFGRIEFGISADLSPELRAEIAKLPEGDWSPDTRWNPRTRQFEPTGLEVAEVPFVPEQLAQDKTRELLRYVATRRLMDEQTLPGLDQPPLPFPTLAQGQKTYRLSAYVTNRWEMKPVDLVRWIHERCGKSEEVHLTLKEELAGGTMPSGLFGANAAWWWCSILAFNVVSSLKQLALGADWVPRRLKALRFHLFHLAGRLYTGARGLTIRLSRAGETLALLLDARRRIADLLPVPGG